MRDGVERIEIRDEAKRVVPVVRIRWCVAGESGELPCGGDVGVIDGQELSQFTTGSILIAGTLRNFGQERPRTAGTTGYWRELSRALERCPRTGKISRLEERGAERHLARKVPR